MNAAWEVLPLAFRVENEAVGPPRGISAMNAEISVPATLLRRQSEATPPGPPEFAVGDGLQAHRLLLFDHLADGGVLHFLEARRVELALLEIGARCLDFRGAEQAPHLIGAERCGTHGEILHLGLLKGQMNLLIRWPLLEIFR